VTKIVKRKAKRGECLILIPARGGSKGIPKKNMALLGGKPLIEFTIRAALKARLPGKICLSTDDEEIRNFGLRFPIEAPFLRPAQLARDDSSTVPVMIHALYWYEKNRGFFPEFLVLLQPTCPFRSPESVRKAYMSILATGVDNLISVNPVREHPCEYIVRKEKGFKFVLPPPGKHGRQHFPEVFFINGAIYITRISYLQKHNKTFDEMAQLYFLKQQESIDIDMPGDLEFANWLYKHKLLEGNGANLALSE